MNYKVHDRTLVWVAIVGGLAGCDQPSTRQPIQVVTVAAAEETREVYVPCAESVASTKLTLSISEPETGDHHESFPLRVEKIAPSRYPAHAGGVTSACGPSSGGDNAAFNRSCYIESGVANAVGIRFKLSYRRGDGTAVFLDELIWATIDRDAVLQLPNGANATVSFTSSRQQPSGESISF